MNNKRNSKIALALSLLLPGLGQIYNGEVSKGISLFLIFAFSIPAFSWLALHGPQSIFWLIVLGGATSALSMYVLCCVDAYRRAQLIGENYTVGPYNKAYVYLSVLLFGYFFVLNQLVTYTKDHMVALYYIPSVSMSPSLDKGDYFFTDKSINAIGSKRNVKRGDVAIFVYPNDRTTIYVKRIIGLPGDQIEIKGNDVSVNGHSLVSSISEENGHKIVSEKSESGQNYKVQWKLDTPAEAFSLSVPNGQVFVLGDNRNEAYDSRKFGTVPLTDVVGLAKQIWFSVGESGLRLNRLGQWLDVN